MQISRKNLEEMDLQKGQHVVIWRKNSTSPFATVYGVPTEDRVEANLTLKAVHESYQKDAVIHTA